MLAKDSIEDGNVKKKLIEIEFVGQMRSTCPCLSILFLLFKSVVFGQIFMTCCMENKKTILILYRFCIINPGNYFYLRILSFGRKKKVIHLVDPLSQLLSRNHAL